MLKYDACTELNIEQTVVLTYVRREYIGHMVELPAGLNDE
jgi:hypothetical protein